MARLKNIGNKNSRKFKRIHLFEMRAIVCAVDSKSVGFSRKEPRDISQ
jgi:hypothetical protein